MVSSLPSPEPSGFADRDLITRVLLREDRHAFSELVRRHQSALRASLRKMTAGNHALADDLAQETFILAWRNIRQFRFEARFSTWLYRIAFNVWQSELRKKHEVTTEDGKMPEGEAVESEAGHTGMRLDLQQAMAVLNEAERNAINQCYYNDLSHEEAAYVLGVPLGTLKTNILKAKEKMRAQLGSYQEEGAVA